MYRRNLWQVLYALSPLEQGLAMWRLGPANLFDRQHPTGHYILDLANSAHEQVQGAGAAAGYSVLGGLKDGGEEGRGAASRPVGARC